MVGYVVTGVGACSAPLVLGGTLNETRKLTNAGIDLSLRHTSPVRDGGNPAAGGRGESCLPGGGAGTAPASGDGSGGGCRAGVAAVVTLTQTLDRIPVGTAYAAFTGIGAVGTVLVGVLAYDEPVSMARLASIGLVVAGVVGLRLAGGSA